MVKRHVHQARHVILPPSKPFTEWAHIGQASMGHFQTFMWNLK